jgi:thiol-disulfide isomerase/thioredoxin
MAELPLESKNMRSLFAFLFLTTSVSPALVGADPMVSVKQTTYAELEKTIQSHKGKVVVVDVWSLGCAPCLKKFPSIVKLAKDHANAGLVVITLTNDEPEDQPKVLEFLKKQNATTANFLLKDSDENARKYEERYPVDSQPMLWVFNKTGERVIKDDGKLKPDQLEAKVKELLAK